MPDDVSISLRLKGRLAAAYRSTTNAVRKSNNEIKRSFAGLRESTKKSADTLKKGFSEAGNSLKDLAKRFGPAAAAVALVTIAFTSLGQASTFVQEKTTEFEKTLSKIQAIAQPTAAGFEDLSNKAKELGESTAFSASQAGQAFVELGKLGFDTNQIIAASADVLNLAAIAETDMATAASVLGESMASFGIEAENAGRAVDVMAKAFSSSALDMNKFSESAKFAGATAADTGISLEETTAALAKLAQHGIAGSMAGTALRRVMLMLSDSTSKAGKMIGLTADDTRTFTERLEALQSLNLSPAQIKNTFGLLATTSASILIKGNEQVKEFTELFKGAQGSAKTMADIMLDNVAGSTMILKSAQEGLALAIGEAFGASKQERLKFYTKLILRAKDAVVAHKDDLILLAQSVTVVIKAFVWLGAQIIEKVGGAIDFIRAGWNQFIEITLKGVRFLLTAFNKVHVFLGEQAVSLEFLNNLIGEFGTEAQKAADNAHAAFTGKDYTEKIISDFKDLGKKLPPPAPPPAPPPEEEDKVAKKAKDAAAKLIDELNVMALGGQEAEEQRLLNWFDQKAAVLLDANENTLLLEAVFRERWEAINEKFRKIDEKKSLELIQKKMAAEKAEMDFKVGIAKQAISLGKTIFGQNKALFIAQQLAAASSVVMNMNAAAIAAIAPPPIGLGPVAGIPLQIKSYVQGGFALAQILAQSIKGFGEGGIQNTPAIANIAERGPEAIIPLRNGAVPVRLEGGTGGGIVIENLNMTMPAGTSGEMVDTFQEQLAGLARNQSEIEVLQVGG